MLLKSITNNEMYKMSKHIHWFTFNETLEDTIIENAHHKELIDKYYSLMSEICQLEDAIRTEWVFANIKSVIVKSENGETKRIFGEQVIMSFENNAMIIQGLYKHCEIPKKDVEVFENGCIQILYNNHKEFFYIPNWEERLENFVINNF